MAPLIRLTKKDQPFSWGVEAENAFQYLKASFTSTPLLIHVNPSKPFVLKTNASDFRLRTMFSQLGDGDLLHLIEFCFCKFFLIEINYEIHDKKTINHC